MTPEQLDWIECGQCGWIGKVADTKQHDLRPMPDDMLCPECSTELSFSDQLTQAEAEAILAEYEA